MRHFMTFALALFVSLAISDSAEAGKKKKGSEDVVAPETTEVAKPEAEPAAMAEIMLTGIADVDNVFTKAVEPLNTLRTARNAIDSMNKSLATTLGLAEGAPLADALNDLKAKAEGKITMAVNEQGMPALSAGDAVPENVQQGIDAINNGVKDVSDAVMKLAELPSQVKEIIASAQAINPQSLMSSGVKPLEAPKMMKSITGNIKLVTSLPAELVALKDAAAELTNSLKSTFGG